MLAWQRERDRHTFEKDKFSIFSLISGIDGCRKAPPEVTDGHGVALKDPPITNPPEPLVLGELWNRRCQWVIMAGLGVSVCLTEQV